MATVEMVMPSMGESIMEGTILKWLKAEGEYIEQDESVLEVATDKVDTEVPAVHSGILKKILAQEGEVVQIGHPIAIIAQEQDEPEAKEVISDLPQEADSREQKKEAEVPVADTGQAQAPLMHNSAGRFYSPLVKNIAKKEGISIQELEQIEGSGKEGRVTKKDILHYVNAPEFRQRADGGSGIEDTQIKDFLPSQQVPVNIGGQDEVIEMNRMRKMIASRMLNSRRISAHVTSFVEADVTNIVTWRNRIKHEYKKRENENLTFTPIFIEAIAQALKEFPMINISVDGDNIIKRKNINVGMAVALSNGNLIVPVIRNADKFNLLGLSKKVNELAEKARQNKLSAGELADGTYTMSNIGSFGNLLGTPIIMQPQVAILALGAIVKKPSVIETPSGDAIGIRHKMYLSHSYDHRVVDGALGGMFVKRVADLLEDFDMERKL